MPVLDAKALDLDPKGAAFLLGVLRQSRRPRSTPSMALRIPSERSPHAGRAHFRFRLTRPGKHLVSDPA